MFVYQVWGQQFSSGNLQFAPLKARRLHGLLARAEVQDDKKNSQPQGDYSYSSAESAIFFSFSSCSILHEVWWSSTSNQVATLANCKK